MQAMMFKVTASLLALACASDLQGTCAAGQQCEQDEAGMLQKTSRVSQVKRHQHLKMKATPTNDAECLQVENINTGLPIAYDPTCPGTCCFETYPCRYQTGTCPRVKKTIDCQKVPNINTGLPIVYDAGCQNGTASCCFETYPCRYDTAGCSAGQVEKKATPTNTATTPTNTAECQQVPGINTKLPVSYDPSCPGPCCFETYPCRYQLDFCPPANTTTDCQKVPNINTGLPIVYDAGCQNGTASCCFGTYPCRYDTAGCSAGLVQKK